MKGIYMLLIALEEPVTKKVGALGEIQFQSGNYIYVGSAQTNLDARVSRHFSSNKKKHWHIDYLLEDADIEEVFAYEACGEKECEMALALDKEFTRVEDFGCSDCNCNSHLFFSKGSSSGMLKKILRLTDEEPVRSDDLDL